MISFTIVDELQRSVTDLEQEEPYAFTLIQGQQCSYLGYAVATAAALSTTVCRYISKGYRYHGTRDLSDAEAIRAWLRWANPDDGWHYRDFNDSDTIQQFLDTCNYDDDSLRNACIEQLQAVAAQQEMTLGITYGTDPADFCHSVIRIYGSCGHKLFLEEYDTMTELYADIRMA